MLNLEPPRAACVNDEGVSGIEDLRKVLDKGMNAGDGRWAVGDGMVGSVGLVRK